MRRIALNGCKAIKINRFVALGITLGRTKSRRYPRPFIVRLTRGHTNGLDGRATRQRVSLRSRKRQRRGVWLAPRVSSVRRVVPLWGATRRRSIAQQRHPFENDASGNKKRPSIFVVLRFSSNTGQRVVIARLSGHVVTPRRSPTATLRCLGAL